MIFSGLVVRHGKPEVVIPELVQRLGADTVQALVFQEEVCHRNHIQFPFKRKVCP